MAASVDGRVTEGTSRGVPVGAVISSGGTRGDKRAISIRISLYMAHVTVLIPLHHTCSVYKTGIPQQLARHRST